MGNIGLQERLTQAVDYLKFKGIAKKQSDIASKLAIPRPHVSAAINGDPKRLTEGFLKRFAAAYKDYINEDWLVSGSGSMAAPDPSDRPHFPASVAAGFSESLSDLVAPADVTWRPFVEGFGNYDFTIDVTGDSMLPEIHSGDTIFCRWLDSPSQIRNKNIYLIDSLQEAVVKQITKISTTSLTLHSLNPSFRDYEMPLEIVSRIAVVVAIIHPLDI